MPRYPSATASSQGLSDAVFSQLAARARGKTGVVYPLHVGDTCLEPIACAKVETLRSDELPGLHAYAPVQGEPALLDAIVSKVKRRCDVNLAREHIQVMSGATAGLGAVANVLLDPGDEVILPAPFWPLIRGIIRARGAIPIEVPLYPRLRTPGFDIERMIEQAVTPRTTALYVNSPHNPTGTILTDDEINALARVAKKHDLWVLSDEVYEDVYYATAPNPLWTHPDLIERTVVTHSMSKGYAMAGARVGYVHGPASIMSAIRGMQTFYTYCAPRPLQLAAARALDAGDTWLDQMRESNRVQAAIVTDGLGIALPAGGTFVFFDVSGYLRAGEDTEALLTRCLDAGVLLTPGSACGHDFDGWARLCFTVVDQASLTDAVQRLKSVLMVPAATNPDR
jgi:N-succinyldiaminopimelate aminotransferase